MLKFFLESVQKLIVILLCPHHLLIYLPIVLTCSINNKHRNIKVLKSLEYRKEIQKLAYLLKNKIVENS